MSTKPTKKLNPKSNAFLNTIKFFKFIIIFLIIVAIIIGFYASKIIYGVAKDSPDLSLNQFINLNEPSVVVDDEGNEFDIIHTDEVRFPLKLNEMGENIKNAFISIEDERFFKHKGVDYRRTISVTVQDFIGRFTGKRNLQGGSTITQQLIKNTYLTREKSIERKIKEIYMALKTEKMTSKEQILETYLNRVFLGGKAHGVEAASNQYFNKSSKDLTILEAAYIAGTTQSPTNYYAFSDSSKENPDKYLNRTKLVLNAMKKNEKISIEEYDAAMDEININAIVFDQTSIITDKYSYEYFTRPVVDELKKDLKEIGYTDEEISALIEHGGLKIYTTMNRGAQDYAQEVLNDFDNINTVYDHKRLREPESDDPESSIITLNDGSKWVEYTTREEAQASFSAVDYSSGEVKILVGGRNDETASGFNRAYYSDTFSGSVLRSIGSSTKPLTVYGPGIDTTKVTLGSIADDTKLTDEELSDLGFNSLNNVTFKFSGNSDIRTSLVNSYNTVSAKTFRMLGNNNNERIELSMDYGKRFGLVFPENTANVGPSTFALGSNYEDKKDGGNPLILANAYGVFGNNGIITEPILYTKVVDNDENILIENTVNSRQIIKAQTAYILYDVMKDVVKNNVPGVKKGAMPIAGKTGTSNDAIDIWFSGVSPYYSASLWIGADQRARLYQSGTNTSQTSYSTQNAFGKIMAYLHEGLQVKDIANPGGIITSSFCIESGQVPNEACYTAETARSDLFIRGTQPTESCSVHVYEEIDLEEEERLAEEEEEKRLEEEKKEQEEKDKKEQEEQDKKDKEEQDKKLQEATNSVTKAENSKSQDDIDAAENLVNNLPDSKEKNNLVKRLNKIEVIDD